MNRVSLLLMILGVTGTSSLHGQQPSDQSADEAAIRQAAASYVEAFNKHDAQAVADHWSPDAVYLNRSTGEEVVGREAIAEQFAALFEEQPELKLEVAVTSIQFVSPNVAIEHGTAKILAPNAEPEETEYSAVECEARWEMVARPCDRQVQRGYPHALRTTQGIWNGWLEAGPTRPPMRKSNSTATGRKTRTSLRGRSRFPSTAKTT